MSFQVMLQQLSSGMVSTMGIFFLTLLFSLPFGLIIAFGRMSKNKIISGFVSVIISILRGTPLMLQLMVWYFFPFYLFGWSISGWRFPAVIVGFSKLCCLLCRDLSFRYRSNSKGTVRSRTDSWIFQGSKLLQNYTPSGY